MRWVYTSYTSPESGKGIKPSFCHPLYYKARNEHVTTKYGVSIDTLKRLERLHVDFGGAIVMGSDPAIEFSIGAQRTFSCWEHQAAGVLDHLQAATHFKHRGRAFYRFSRWPGVLCFISGPDRDKIIRGLRAAS